MKIKYIRGSSVDFLYDKGITTWDNEINGIYIHEEKTAYIFVNAIAHQAFFLGKNPKDVQRKFIRLRRLVEYHEFAHHMQLSRGWKYDTQEEQNRAEMVADRYAMLRYRRDYHRDPEIPFDRSRQKNKEVLV